MTASVALLLPQEATAPSDHRERGLPSVLSCVREQGMEREQSSYTEQQTI